jgi:hypothetical protein
VARKASCKLRCKLRTQTSPEVQVCDQIKELKNKCVGEISIKFLNQVSRVRISPAPPPDGIYCPERAADRESVLKLYVRATDKEFSVIVTFRAHHFCVGSRRIKFVIEDHRFGNAARVPQRFGSPALSAWWMSD